MSSLAQLIVEPDEETQGCAVVRVEAQVGEQTVSFILDSGAARTQLIDGVAAVTNRCRDLDGSRGVFGVGSGDLAEVTRLALAGVSRSPWKVRVVAAGQHRENLLGVDFFDGGCWELSFTDAVLRAAASPAQPSWPLQRGPRGHVHLTPVWDTVAANACWDTGAGITVVDAEFARAHASQFTPIGTSLGRDSAGEEQESETVLMAGPRLGELQLHPSVAAIVDLSDVNATLEHRLDLILGYPLISQADWTIDLAANCWSARLRS